MKNEVFMLVLILQTIACFHLPYPTSVHNGYLPDDVSKPRLSPAPKPATSFSSTKVILDKPVMYQPEGRYALDTSNLHYPYLVASKGKRLARNVRMKRIKDLLKYYRNKKFKDTMNNKRGRIYSLWTNYLARN